MSAIANMARLTKAGAVIAWSGARVLPDEANLPAPLALFGRVTAPLRKNGAGDGNETQLSEALTSLGPSYIKLGQFLATRDDIIGRELAGDLSTLQDRLPPFSQDEARAAVEEALGAPIDTAFRRVRPAGRRRLDRAGAQGAACASPTARSSQSPSRCCGPASSSASSATSTAISSPRA